MYGTGAGSLCARSSTRHRCRGKRLLPAGVQTEDGCSIIGAVAGPPASPASKKQEYHFNAEALECPLPLSQTQIADATGLSSVHANRVLQRLRKTS
jgi:CRP-like cAMP-binding protein